MLVIDLLYQSKSKVIVLFCNNKIKAIILFDNTNNTIIQYSFNMCDKYAESVFFEVFHK